MFDYQKAAWYSPTCQAYFHPLRHLPPLGSPGNGWDLHFSLLKCVHSHPPLLVLDQPTSTKQPTATCDLSIDFWPSEILHGISSDVNGYQWISGDIEKLKNWTTYVFFWPHTSKSARYISENRHVMIWLRDWYAINMDSELDAMTLIPP